MTSIIDLVIEIAIPVLTIGLIWSLVIFAITLKGIFYPGQEGTLTRVFFLFVMGTVMANRLAGLYGETQKATFYSIALVGVMALFTLVFSSRYGAFLGGTDAGEGLWANLVIVAIIGFASYKICRESSFDIKSEKEESVIALRRKVREQQDWYLRMEYEEEEQRKKEEEERAEIAKPQATPPKKHPGIWVIYFSLFSMVVFAVGQHFLAADSWVFYARAFRCLLGNLVCALGLLLLTELSSLRFQCWQKKTRIPDSVGAFWILTGGFLIVSLVALASLPPRPVPEYVARSTTVNDEFESMPDNKTEEATKTRPPKTWAGMTRKIEAELEKEERDRRKMKEELEGGKEEGEQNETGEEDKEVGGSGGGTEEGEGGSHGQSEQKGGSSGGSQQGGGQKGMGTTAAARRPPMATPPLQGLEMLGKIVLIIFLALALIWGAMVLFAAISRTNPFARLSEGLRNLTAGLRGLFRRKRRPRLTGRKLKATLEQEHLYMENPFRNRALLKRMSTGEIVAYTYRAFENYAHIQGHTPQSGQTPIEFMKSLPEELQATEFASLLRLFMLAEYSPHSISEESVGELDHVWAKIEA